MTHHHTDLEADAWNLFNAEKWEDALTKFTAVLQLDAARKGGLQGEIACLRKLRKFEEAAKELDEALKQYPQSIGLLAERVWLNVEQKKYNQAINALRAILSQSTKHVDAAEQFSWLVTLLRIERRYEEAETTLNQALAIPDFENNYSLQIDRGWLYFYEERFEDAVKTFDAVLAQHPADAMAIQGRLACLRLQGAFDEAAIEAKRALVKNRKRPGILSEMAWLSWEKGDYAQASHFFEEVAAIMPNDPYAHVNLAASLVKEGDKALLQKAAENCQEALKLDSALPEARGCLGVIAFRRGRIAEAELQLRKSVERGAREGSYADLGALFTSMGRYDEAEKVLKQGLSVKTPDAALHLELGNLYLQTENSRGAIAEYRQAIALDRKNPEPVRALAVALMESGKLGEAEAVLRNAIRTLDKLRRWRLHVTLCQLLTRLADETGDSQLCGEALKEANLALILATNQPDAHFCCAIARYKMEDYRGAQRHFRICQELDESRVDAEINARIVKKFIVQEKLRSRLLASFSLAAVILLQLGLLWWWRLKYGADDKHAIVTGTMLTVLVPVCLGLIVVSVLLPSLTKLKLTGFEAELSQQHGKETLASGPKGQIGFSSSSLAASGALAGGARPQPI